MLLYSCIFKRVIIHVHVCKLERPSRNATRVVDPRNSSIQHSSCYPLHLTTTKVLLVCRISEHVIFPFVNLIRHFCLSIIIKVWSSLLQIFISKYVIVRTFAALLSGHLKFPISNLWNVTTTGRYNYMF